MLAERMLQNKFSIDFISCLFGNWNQWNQNYHEVLLSLLVFLTQSNYAKFFVIFNHYDYAIQSHWLIN